MLEMPCWEYDRDINSGSAPNNSNGSLQKKGSKERQRIRCWEPLELELDKGNYSIQQQKEEFVPYLRRKDEYAIAKSSKQAEEYENQQKKIQKCTNVPQTYIGNVDKTGWITIDFKKKIKKWFFLM